MHHLFYVVILWRHTIKFSLVLLLCLHQVNIARGVYANAEVYMFDDPLSALDAHVTAEVFKLCIKQHLSHTTRVLVTNQLHLMPEMDRIIVMKQGRIEEIGTFQDLIANTDGEFHRLYAEMQHDEDEEDSEVLVDIDDDSQSEPDVTEKAVSATEAGSVGRGRAASSAVKVVKESIPKEEAKSAVDEAKKVWHSLCACTGPFLI
jgi:ATP-binding cassette, subfamily C (CFTR/MRP), member 1